MEGGLGHTSNGRSEDESRSYNRVFIRPLLGWSLGEEWRLHLEPEAFVYFGDLDDNPDIADFRGHVGLIVTLGQEDGWQLRSEVRFADVLRHSSATIALSHPLGPLTRGWIDGYLYLQTFIGYSESLLDYDQKTEPPRLLFGFAITR